MSTAPEVATQTESSLPTERVMVVGVTSPVARAIATEFARRGRSLLLTGRDTYELNAISADIRIRYGVDVQAETFDALEFAGHDELMETAAASAVSGVIVALGTMGDQIESQANFDEARRVLDTNYTACVSILEGTARLLESQEGGFICAIGSVAGDRGRQSNYLYGSAKAGLSAYLQGLRNRMHQHDIGVTTVKPGFIDTRMTYGKVGTLLLASPEAAGRSIYTAIQRGRSVVYVPWFWRLIMGVISSIPEPIFKRLRL